MIADSGQGHLCVEGVKRVVVTAPSSDVPMIILGVNDDKLRPDHKVISCTSSTLYCLAPIMKILENNFGVSEGFVTSIHAMTPSLKPLDGLCLRGKHWRDFRSIHQNVIPAMTGACKALGKILPQLKDKMMGLAFRVPIVNVSVLDLTVRLNKDTSLQQIIKCVEHASRTYLKGILDLSKEEAVSSDFLKDSHSCIMDVNSSMQFNSKFYKIICWYENELSYACRVIDLIVFCERQFAHTQVTLGRNVDPDDLQLRNSLLCLKKSFDSNCSALPRPILLRDYSRNINNGLYSVPASRQISISQQGTSTRWELKAINKEGKVPRNNDPIGVSVEGFNNAKKKLDEWEQSPSPIAQSQLDKANRELNKMMNITQGLLKKSTKLCASLNIKESVTNVVKDSINSERSNAVKVPNVANDNNKENQFTFMGCSKREQGKVGNGETQRSCLGRGDTRKENFEAVAAKHTKGKNDVNKYNAKSICATDSGGRNEQINEKVITKLEKSTTSFTSDNNKKKEEHLLMKEQNINKHKQKPLHASDMATLNFTGDDTVQSFKNRCTENVSRYIVLENGNNESEDKILQHQFIVQKRITCGNVALHSSQENMDASIRSDEHNEDIFDKLDSTSATNSENSFHVNEKQSQVICINDLTNSLEDLSRLDKICKIIEISDDLSDELFATLNFGEATNVKNKKWSFNDLCDKIKLDDFCDKIFHE